MKVAHTQSTGWTLLALAIGLVNGGGGLTALYILLTCLAWTVFLLVVGRRALHWLARKTGSIEGGPTVSNSTGSR